VPNSNLPRNPKLKRTFLPEEGERLAGLVLLIRDVSHLSFRLGEGCASWMFREFPQFLKTRGGLFRK
jgi:hypothetical protein